MPGTVGRLYAEVVGAVRGRLAARHMLLAPDLVRWLRSRVARRARAYDLAWTYGFAHPLVHGRALVKAALEEEGFAWAITLLDSAGRSLLLSPLTRHVGPDRPLVGRSGTGTVAFNEEFFLRSDALRKRIGTSVYRQEANLYARWQVEEIHLEAIDDGLVVWIRKGFVPQNPGLLAAQFAAWARAHGHLPEAPSRAADYPEPFLRSLPWLALYKEVQK